MDRTVEILCIGNELLIGKTLNSNGQWVAKQVTRIGLNVKRITSIGDDKDEIASAARTAVRRNVHFLITTGGLGPTFDDTTMEGLNQLLTSELEINDQALQMIKTKYSDYVKQGITEKAELTPARIKMARFPKGATPLPNPVGTAPGVMFQVANTTIVALPGVPSEMKAIFHNSVVSLLKEKIGKITVFETSLEVIGIMESEMAPLIDQIKQQNPHIYIKSHPKGAETISQIEFHLYTSHSDVNIARKRVTSALIQLSETIKTKGGKIRHRRNIQ